MGELPELRRLNNVFSVRCGVQGTAELGLNPVNLMNPGLVH